MIKYRLLLFWSGIFSLSSLSALEYSNELRMILQQDRYSDIRHTESAMMLKLGAESELTSYLKVGGAAY